MGRSDACGLDIIDRQEGRDDGARSQWPWAVLRAPAWVPVSALHPDCAYLYSGLPGPSHWACALVAFPQYAVWAGPWRTAGVQRQLSRRRGDPSEVAG